MAEIYRAKTFGAAGFEKEFAIKLILPSLVDDSEFVEMFINEAKLAVNLYHANIVQVFDLGELDNQYYIAMEYVHGKDLLDVLARCAELNIKIPLDLVLFIAMEMLKGLDFAHQAKDPYGEPLDIIHRDVSPSNIMISYAGDVKVGDFGVAKAAIERSLTEAGTLKGKVGYMSPEQVMGEQIDARSDLFAASIVLFEAISMSRLFVGDSDLDVMTKVRDADIAESMQKAQPLPSDLVDIIRRGLTRHREERFQTAGEFYQALVDFCFQHSIKVTGSDLSTFMRRLFAEEIEEEKRKRRSEPGGEALSQEMAAAERREREAPEADDGLIEDTTAAEDVQEQDVADSETDDRDSQDAVALDDTARVKQPHTGDKQYGKKLDDLGRETTEFEEMSEDSESEHEYRYRDDSGLVYGPMGADTLVDLLQVRRPRDADRVSVDGGDWLPLDEFPDLDLEQRRKVSERPDSSPEQKIPVDSSREASPADTIQEPGVVVSDESDDDDGKDAGVKQAGILQKSSATDEKDEPDEPEVEDNLDGPKSPVAVDPPKANQSLGASDTIQELKEQYASYEGKLGEVSVARILARLNLVEETGRLFVHRDGVEKSIFLRDGEPIFIQSNRDEELLGRFLLSRDLISQDELDEALDRLDEWGGRLGDALVAIDAIPAHALFEHLSAQAREKLLEIFEWSGGQYGYYENQEPESQGYSLGLDTFGIIVEGCRERVAIEDIRDAYENRSFVSIYRNDPPPFDIDNLALRTRESRVVNKLDPGDTLQELVDKFPPDQHETVYRAVYLMHQIELFSFEVTGKVDLPSLDGSS